MAAVTSTAGTRRDFVTGNIRMIKEDITSVDNTDTWDPGLRIIENALFVPTTAGAGTQWGVTIANATATVPGRVTFVIESGTLAGTMTAWGY